MLAVLHTVHCSVLCAQCCIDWWWGSGDHSEQYLMFTHCEHCVQSVVLTVATDAVANGFDSSTGFSTLGFLSPNLAFFLSNLSDPLKQISRQSAAVVLF